MSYRNSDKVGPMTAKSNNPSYEGFRHAAGRGHASLESVKAQALRVSASARNVPVNDVREAFGFMPVGIQGVVIRWPSL